MKKLLSLVLALCFVFSSQEAFANHEARKLDEIPRISVKGKGKVKARPDKATVSFSIVNVEKTAEKARKENAATAKKVLRAVKSLDIDEKFTNLESLRISEKREYRDRRYVSLGYEANRSFTVELHDLEKLPKLVANVVKYGSNELSSVDYGLQNPEIAEAEALLKAINKAQEKAELMVGPLGVELGKAIKITESYNSGFVRSARAMDMAMTASYDKAEAEPEAYSSGELEVEANVDIQFEIL